MVLMAGWSPEVGLEAFGQGGYLKGLVFEDRYPELQLVSLLVHLFFFISISGHGIAWASGHLRFAWRKYGMPEWLIGTGL